MWTDRHPVVHPLRSRGDTFRVQVTYSSRSSLVPTLHHSTIAMRISGLKGRYHGRRRGAAAGNLVWWMTVCLSILTVSGWGTIGHQVVANLAWYRLSNQTRQAIQEILGNDDKNGTEVAGSPLASVADWADQVRNYYHWSGGLHYIDVQDEEISGGCPSYSSPDHPKKECHFVYDRDCPNDVCVAGAIQNYTKQLGEWSSARTVHYLRQRSSWSQGGHEHQPPVNQHFREALMFVTHFVGDIHQPLHASRSSDKGGNDFHVHIDFPVGQPHLLSLGSDSSNHHKAWNLHSVWDTAIIEHAIDQTYSSSREAFENHLEEISHSVKYNSDVIRWLQCPDGRSKDCTVAWGEESFQAALTFAYRNSDDTEVVDGSVLDESYCETRLEVVQKQLIAAGIRLAVTLEHILNPLYVSPKDDAMRTMLMSI